MNETFINTRNQSKICTKCQIEKTIIEFHKDKNEQDGSKSICKECRSTRKPGYGEKISPPDQKFCVRCNILKSILEFPLRKECKDGHRNVCYDCTNHMHKQYRKDNYDRLYLYHLNYGKIHRKNNREKYRKYVENYRIKYPERRKEQDRKRRQIPYFRIKQNLRSRLRDILRKQGAVKSNKTMNLIGCSIDFLMNYLESLFYNNKTSGEPMTKLLLSTPKIELDHIIPLWRFDLTNPEEQKRAFCYTNMQPMWSEDHKIKSANDYIEYCRWKKINKI